MGPRAREGLFDRPAETLFQILVELGLAKGKHTYDKRAAIARKTSEREIERALKGRNR